MGSKWFVIWIGNLSKDPLDKGVEHFNNVIDAVKFAELERNKGGTCYVYQGIFYKEVF